MDPDFTTTRSRPEPAQSLVRTAQDTDQRPRGPEAQIRRPGRRGSGECVGDGPRVQSPEPARDEVPWRPVFVAKIWFGVVRKQRRNVSQRAVEKQDSARSTYQPQTY
jgi:hypothetical protein